VAAPQQCLNLRPLPQGQGALRAGFIRVPDHHDAAKTTLCCSLPIGNSAAVNCKSASAHHICHDGPLKQWRSDSSRKHAYQTQSLRTLRLGLKFHRK
jgi:hypothetical protein